MITCLGKSCSFGLLCVSFMNVYHSNVYRTSFLFGFEGRMWDLTVLVPDLCHSFYVTFLNLDYITQRFSYLPAISMRINSSNKQKKKNKEKNKT